MAEKDFWDKSEVIIKLIGSVVLVAIPVMISVGANRISQSMERGKLVESLLSELANEQKQARRDLALIALDASVPPPEQCGFLGLVACRIDEAAPDMVSDVALVLWRQLDDQSQLTEAAKIVQKRKPGTYRELLASEGQVTSSPDLKATLSREKITQTAQKAEILSKLDSRGASKPEAALQGVRAVYIQYRSDIRAAEKIRDALQKGGVSVPRLELVPGIRQNDIRYRAQAEKDAAERLKSFLGSNLNVQIADDKLIDLESRGYRVPVGQFEVWIDE